MPNHTRVGSPSELDVTRDPVAFARAMDEMPTGVLVLDGPRHLVVGANRVAREFLRHRTDLLGRPVGEILPPGHGDRLLAALDQVSSTGEPFSAVEWSVPVGRPNDRDERAISFDVVPLPGPDGATTGLLCQFTDVTDESRWRLALEDYNSELDGRYREVRDRVLALQRILLPGRLPVLPGFRVAARYLVPGAEQAAGGDWFDAIPMDGLLFAVVGDVVGQGAAAAAVMGQLRALLTEFLLDGDDLPVALSRLDRFAGRTPRARGATVCVSLLDPATGSVRYACAGHPPPLVVRADGGTRYLPAPPGGPLGVAGPGPVVGHETLAPGDMLMTFSDGLVERAGHDASRGLVQLAEVASAAATSSDGEPADLLAGRTLEMMTMDGYSDDVTVLVVRRTGQSAEEFRADLPAEPGQLAELRTRLETWLTGLGACDDDVVAVQIGVLETVTNAVEHAYDAPGGRVQVEGTVDGNGRASLTVIDHGRWRRAAVAPGKRGRGLLMVRGCMDTVEIETTAEGTAILLDRQLSRTPVIDLGTPTPPRNEPATVAEVGVRVTQADEPRIALSGPVDMGSVSKVRSRLWSASQGGALPLTVDLTEVSHLASAGVQLLFDFLEDSSTDGRKVRIVAPAHCPARFALSVSGLDQIAVISES